MVEILSLWLMLPNRLILGIGTNVRAAWSAVFLHKEVNIRLDTDIEISYSCNTVSQLSNELSYVNF